MLNMTRLCAGVVLSTVIFVGDALSQTPVPWKDGFEAVGNYAPNPGYVANTDPTVSNIGGWERWDNAPMTGARINTTFAASGTQSLFNGGNSDIVQRFNVTSGKWSLRSRMYVPSSGPQQLTKTTWYILMNLYNANGPKHWALQVSFNPATGNVFWSGGTNNGATFNYTANQWMCLDTRIDLDNDAVNFFVDGRQLGTTSSWTTGTSANPNNYPARISAINLWSNNQTTATNPNGGVSYDDFSLTAIPGLNQVFCCPKTRLVCGPAFIRKAGTPGPTGGNDFVITAGPTRACRSGLLLYSSQPIVSAAPFGGPGNGVLCLTPQGLRRAGPIDSGGSNPSACDGSMSINIDRFKAGAWTATGCMPATGQNNPAAFLNSVGTQVHGQIWGRDSVATGQVLSDAIRWTTGG